MLEVVLLDKKLHITKNKALKGDDGYKVFSVRIRDDVSVKLDEISAKTNRSRNEIVGIMLEYGIENCEIEE